MANPKRRKSLSKQRMRQHSNRWIAPQITASCKECGTPLPSPHIVCPSCGRYKGRQVLDIVAKGDE